MKIYAITISCVLIILITTWIFWKRSNSNSSHAVFYSLSLQSALENKSFIIGKKPQVVDKLVLKMIVDFIIKNSDKNDLSESVIHISLYKNNKSAVENDVPLFTKINRWSFICKKNTTDYEIKHYGRNEVYKFSKEEDLCSWLETNLLPK